MTGITNVALPMDVLLDRALLLRVNPAAIHLLFADKAQLPQNVGTQTIKFRRYSNLTNATSALTEGTVPSAKTLSVTDVTGLLAQYGTYVKIFDRLAGYTAESIFGVSGDILGDNAAQTFDVIARDVIFAGSTVEYASDSSARVSINAGDTLALSDIQAAVLTLKGNNARQFTSIAQGTDQVGTSPIRASYFGFVHTSVRNILKGLTGFTEAHKYPSTVTPLANELGEIEGVRWIETTNGKVFAGSGASAIDVYASLIVAQGFYGITEPGGPSANGGPPSPLALQFIAKPFNTGDKADPLNQKATSGWKADFITVILNQAFGVRLEHALV